MRFRIMAFLLAAMMLSGLMFGQAQASYGGMIDSLTWTMEDDGLMTINGTGAMSDFSVETWQSVPWNGSRDNIRSLTVEGTAENLGAWTFYNCPNLTEVTLSEGVKKVGDYAFSACTGLEKIHLPDSLTEIGESAFYANTALKELDIPKGVSMIGEDAFRECGALERIRVATGNPAFSDRDGILFDHDQTTLVYCPAGKEAELRLPATVKRIGRCALADCHGLTEVLFEGSAEQWKEITVEEGNDPLLAVPVRFVEPVSIQPEARELDLTDVRVNYEAASGLPWEGALGLQSIYGTVNGPSGRCCIRIAGVTDTRPTATEALKTAEQAVKEWKGEGGYIYTKETPCSFAKSRPVYPEDLNKIQYVLLVGQDENADLVGYTIIETEPIPGTDNGTKGTLTALDGSGTVTWELQDSGEGRSVLVAGDLSTDWPVLAAIFSGEGRMLSAESLTQTGSVIISDGEVVKLFWLSAETGSPKSACAEIPINGNDT